MKSPIFYHKKPIFGLDIGSQTMKFVQLKKRGDAAYVEAYGSIVTNEKIMKNGIITNIAQAAKQLDELLDKHCIGTLTTNRIAMSVPVSHVYTRVLTLPTMSKKELASAVQLEVEQSVPMPLKNLYYNFETTDTGDPENMLVRMVAVPRAVIDSYQAVCDLLNLDLAFVQTNIRADAQLCMLYEEIGKASPYIIVDVGGNSIDVGILDATLRVTGTVEEGGNSLTEAIGRELHLSHDKAHIIKVKNGIAAGPQREKVLKAVTPILDKVCLEIKRMTTFYDERVTADIDISQILIVGGGANMPGLGDYLTNQTRIPARVSSPWAKHILFGKLEPPELADLPRFLTCSGLALNQDDGVDEL